MRTPQEERPAPLVQESLAARVFANAGASRWDVPFQTFLEALEVSARKAFAERTPSVSELSRYLDSLHLEDLALACACALGREAAWEHFIREHRPGLYRAADAIDRSGGARELVDSLYADLYGLQDRGQGRQSLFRYFHGRSTLGTWLRSVLAQRHVDRLRADRRLEPLTDEQPPASASTSSSPDPDRPRFIALIEQTLSAAAAALPPRDRLRLGCYYAQGMTLAQIGRLLREHEATVSRHLTRTRRAIREDIERRLQEQGLGPREIDECFASVARDAGPIDLDEVLGVAGARKIDGVDRSTSEGSR